MKKLIGLFVILLMVGLVVAEIETATTLEELEVLREKMKADNNLPEFVKDGFTKSRFIKFTYELSQGATTIKYVGEIRGDGRASGSDSKGLEFISRVDEQGGIGSKMHLLRESELTYKDGELISANIKVPVICEGRVCPPDAGKGKGYELGNRIYPVAPGSTVKYDLIKNGESKEEVVIESPDGSLIYPSKKIDLDKKDGEVSIKYKTKKGNMKVPSSNEKNEAVLFQSVNYDDGPLKYEMSYDVKNELFYLGKDQYAGTRNIDIGSIGSADRTYLFIDKEIPKGFVAGSAVNFASEEGAKPLQLYTPEGKGGFGVRFRASEKPGFGGLHLKKDEEFILYSFGGGKTSSGKDLVDFDGEKIPNGDSRVAIGVRAEVEGRTRTPEIQSIGAFQVIDGKNIYFGHSNTNGVRTRHFEGDYVFEDKLTGKRLTVEFDKSKPTPVKILAKENDGEFLKYKGVKGELKEAKFGIFVDSHYNGYNSIRVATSKEEEALFSNVNFNEFDLERQELLELVTKQGRNTQDTFATIDLLKSDGYDKLSDAQKKTVNTAIGQLKDLTLIENVITQEVKKRDVSLEKLLKDQMESQTQTNNDNTNNDGGLLTGRKIKIEDLHPVLKGVKGVSLFSDVGRKDGKFVVKVGFPNCPGCIKLGKDLQGINGPVIDVNTNVVQKIYWKNFVNQYGEKNNKGQKTVPITVYFQKDRNGKVREIGGSGYSRANSGVRDFFKN